MSDLHMSLETYFICGSLPSRAKYSFEQIVSFADASGLKVASRWYAANSPDDWRKDIDDDDEELLGGSEINVDLDSMSGAFGALSPKGCWSLIWFDAVPKQLAKLPDENSSIFDGWCPHEVELVCGPQIISDGLNEEICYRGNLSLRISGGGSPSDFEVALTMVESLFRRTELFACFSQHFEVRTSFSLTCR